MADLDPLIRYRKYGVDEKRRFLARLYEEAEKLEAARQEAEENIEKERRLAEELGSAESLSALGRYTEAMRRKIKKSTSRSPKWKTGLRRRRKICAMPLPK